MSLLSCFLSLFLVPFLSLSLYLLVLSISLHISPSPCLSLSLSLCLSVCLSVCLSACLPVCLSACLSVCLSVCLSLTLYIYIYIYIYLSLCLFSLLLLYTFYAHKCERMYVHLSLSPSFSHTLSLSEYYVSTQHQTQLSFSRSLFLSVLGSAFVCYLHSHSSLSLSLSPSLSFSLYISIHVLYIYIYLSFFVIFCSSTVCLGNSLQALSFSFLNHSATSEPVLLVLVFKIMFCEMFVVFLGGGRGPVEGEKPSDFPARSGSMGETSCLCFPANRKMSSRILDNEFKILINFGKAAPHKLVRKKGVLPN